MTCAVCLELCDTRLACGHSIHDDCLRRLALHQMHVGALACPMCREPVVSAALDTLFETVSCMIAAVAKDSPPLTCEAVQSAGSWFSLDDPITAKGHTCLQLAAARGSPASAAQLLRMGASPDADGGLGTRPLAVALSTNTPSHAAVAALLVEAGADVNARFEQPESPLHLAVRAKKMPLVTMLLAAGALAAEVDEYGGTPLHDAARLKVHAAVRPLIGAGADPSTTDADGLTALHLAAESGSLRTVKALMRMGACVRATSPRGLPYELALCAGHHAVAEFLVVASLE